VSPPPLQPDDPITSIDVIVHTSMRDGSSSDNDVYVGLFAGDDDYWPEIDSDDNDFETGDIKSYALPSWYFAGRIVNDIRRLCLHTEWNSSTDWGLGWIALKVNGTFLYQPPSMQKTKTVLVWFAAGDTWCVDDFKPLEFTAPKLASAGLPDASPDQKYEPVLTAVGGRKPLTWELEQPSFEGFVSVPTLTAIGDTRQARLEGHTLKGKDLPDTVEWSAALVIKDADGKIDQEYTLHMRVIKTLPAPTIASFDPIFGWPKTPPTVPEAVVVTVRSKDDDFDSRKPDATQVLFPSAGGGEIGGKLAASDQITSSEIKVLVPKGAVPGKLKVRTAFGEVTSAGTFTAHPTGFRFTSGFPFTNSSSFFPDEFAWERYEETFGMDEMWMTAFDNTIVPDPIATAFWSFTQFFIGEGCCHGYCLSSLQLQAGLLGSNAYGGGSNYPLEEAIWGLGDAQTGPNYSLSNLIQSRQLAMLSDEALSYYLDELDDIPNVSGQLCEMDARPALTDVKASVGGEGWTNPRMIALAHACWPWEGHVVLPYGTGADQAAANLEDIFVYDPNKPAQIKSTDDRKSYIAVKPESGQWNYPFNYGGSDAKDFSGLYLFTIPFELYGHQYDWSIPSPETLISGDIGLILLGCAGTDKGGRTLQLSDEQGRTLIERGQLVRDRERWPDSARVIPLLGVEHEQHPLIALIKKARLSWIVAPRGEEPTLLSIVRGSGLTDSGLGLTVEEIETQVVVTHDGEVDEIAAAPMKGQASVILRVDRRFRETLEGLRWSVRVKSLAAGKPVALRPAPDGRGVVLEPKTADQCEFDVRVEHRDRMGRTRTLQCDGLTCPAEAHALLQIAPEQIGSPDAKPLHVEVRKTSDDPPISEIDLGEQFSTPVVRLPARMISDAPGSDLKAKRSVALSMGATMGASGDSKVQLHARGETLSMTPRGPRLMLAGGSRPVRVVAVDEQGRRSFPHEIFITIPEPGKKPVPVHSLAPADVMATPGSTVSIPVSCFVDGIAVHDVTFALSARDRLSGASGPMLGWRGRGTFLPAAELDGVEVEVTKALKVGKSWLNVQVHLSWDSDRAKSGLFELGELRLIVPPEMSYGSMFVIRGLKGTALAGSSDHDLNVIPSAIRIWGGPEPSEVSIRGSDEVSEDETIELELDAKGIAQPPSNSGWWLTYHGGRAELGPIPGKPTRVALTGKRAGPVVVHVVCGHITAERAFRIRPTVRQNVYALASKLRLQNLSKILK
jgi:hypothetical protein